MRKTQIINIFMSILLFRFAEKVFNIAIYEIFRKQKRIKYISLICFMLFFSQNFFSQNFVNDNVKFEVDSKIFSLSDLLSQIENKTAYSLIYSPAQFDMKKRVSFKNRLNSLNDYLKYLSAKENLRIVVNGKNIYLIKNYNSTLKSGELLSISGFVKDYESGELLLGALIKPEKSLTGKITDESGYFNIKIPQTENEIVISYTGYSPLVVNTSELKSDLNSVFYLKRNIVLQDVIIKDKLYTDNAPGLNDFEYSKNLFKVNDDIKILGYNDMFSEMLTMPGIEKINDFQGGISINGLSPGDNIYMLDGIRIFEPNHIFGLFSIFNSSSINKVSLYSNNIPVEYPSGFSALINSHQKEGNFERRNITAGISSGNGELHFEGPFLKYKTSFLFDARKSLLGLYIPKILETKVNYNLDKMDFLDINFKVTHKISPGNKVNLVFYTGNDIIKIKNQYDSESVSSSNSYKWSNQALGLHWTYLFRDDLKSDINLSFSRYKNNSSSRFNLFSNKYLYIISNTNIRDISFRHLLKYYFAGSTLKIGYSGSKTNILPVLKSELSTDNISPGIVENNADSIYYDLMSFVSYKYEAIDNLKIKAGGQLGRIWNKYFSGYYFNPRFSAGYKLKNHLYLELGYSRNIKRVHSLGSYAIGIPSMIWVNSNGQLPVSTMDNYSLNFMYMNSRIYLRAELYFKNIFNALKYKNINDSYNPVSSKGVVIPVFNTSGDINDDVFIGTGKAYGLNISSRLNFSNLQLTISASVNRNWFEFDDLNEGERFPGKYDMLYSNSVLLNYKQKHFDFYLYWHNHSGQVFTLPKYIYTNDEGDDIVDYSCINNSRMADYQSLNLGVEYRLKSKYFKWKISTGISNVYNHFNPVYVYLYRADDVYKASQVSGIPVFPYLKLVVFSSGY